MAEGACRERWDRTTAIQATIINSNPHRRNPNRVVQPAELNPYRLSEGKKPKDPKVIRTTLRELYQTMGNSGLQKMFAGARPPIASGADDAELLKLLADKGLHHLMPPTQ
jgi:hypothetical protein